MDLLSISIKIVLDVNHDHGWRLKGYRKGENSDRFSKYLFPMEACMYVTWMSPGVELLVSTSISGKFVQTRLNFDPNGSSKRMAYRMKRRF